MTRSLTALCQPIPLNTWQLLGCCIFISTYLIYITSFPSKWSIVFNENINRLLDNNLEYLQKDWQDVGNPHFKFWVYSAYEFGDGQVVVLGTPSPFESKSETNLVRCSFYWLDNPNNYTTKNNQVTTIAKIEMMKGWNVKWAGTFIRCPLPNSSGTPPTFVSIFLKNQTESSVQLPINYRIQHENYQFKFSVCVLPLYGYNEVFHFLEWLEFYKMMGVQQFTFYNRSIGPQTSCILNHLKEEPSSLAITVQVNPWHGYPQENDADIRFGVGLSAGTNACLYSHKGVSKYMIFLDVDELIVPLQGIQNYHKLLEYLEENATSNSRYGGFTFRNGFYFKSRDNDPQLLERCSGLRNNANQFHACQQLWTMAYFQREPLNDWGSRSKYIAVPDGVRHGGNHYVIQFERGWKEMKTSENVAFSRHYRNPTSKNVATNYSVERMPLEMGIQLSENVAQSVDYFMKICNISAVDMYQ